MTATDELCQLLDERNEEYKRRGNSICTPSHEWVGWYFNLADRAYFYEYPDGHTKLITYRYDYDFTPEQAIAATLGSCNCSDNCTNGERTSDELNPCPFCGGIPMVDCGYHYDYDGGNRYYAYSADVECCCGCTLHVEHKGPKEYVTDEHMLDFAITAWNRSAKS